MPLLSEGLVLRREPGNLGETVLAGATRLELATSGSTGRRSKPTELRPRLGRRCGRLGRTGQLPRVSRDASRVKGEIRHISTIPGHGNPPRAPSLSRHSPLISEDLRKNWPLPGSRPFPVVVRCAAFRVAGPCPLHFPLVFPARVEAASRRLESGPKKARGRSVEGNPRKAPGQRFLFVRSGPQVAFPFGLSRALQ